MRPYLLVSSFLAVGTVPATAFGQAGDGGTATATAAPASAAPALDVEALKAEMRESLRLELKEELKSEIKAELAEEQATAAPVADDAAWAEEEWKWEEPVKPELNFLEFDGYFRFRYDFFYNLDLGTYYQNTETNQATGPFAPGYAPPVPLCNTNIGTRPNPNGTTDAELNGPDTCANRAGEGNSLGGANMRLRLEPVFNVYEDVKVKMQIDVFDNLVLGSTPDGFGYNGNPISPLSGFSQTQLAPTAGVNTIWRDSIRVKRAWAEVMTPLGQLRFGRMPSHFGMGLLANEGKGLDADFGDSNDRIMFATKIGDFYVVPAYDWVVSGPTSAIDLDPYGQPFDRDQRDDVDQYILAIVKRDKPEAIAQKLANDEWVFNFGTYQVGRFQALDSADFFRNGQPQDAATTDAILERDTQAYIYSYWAKFQWRKLTIEAEYAGILGKIGNASISGPYSADSRDGVGDDGSLFINQHAATADIQYKLLKDALTLQLLVVVASGDGAPGWGVRPLSSVSAINGAWDGTQAPDGDNRITNFRLDPNYIVDMIFWRQLVGTITDALVVRPSVQYNLTEGLGARLDLVYSRALSADSTPSGSFDNGLDTALDNGETILGRKSANLGVEADFKLFYDSDDGFHAWFQYGLFIPMSGLDRQVAVESFSNLAEGRSNGEPVARIDASLAHTMQLMLGVTF